MIDPKEITLKTQRGEEKTFFLSKFPAVAGREIVVKYPTANLPKLGEYQASEETMLKLMSFCAVKTETGAQALTTRALVDNHAGDWETLARLEYAMLEYNCSFFGKGLNSVSFESISRKAVELIIQTWTASLAVSSQTGKPPSTS